MQEHIRNLKKSFQQKLVPSRDEIGQEQKHNSELCHFRCPQFGSSSVTFQGPSAMLDIKHTPFPRVL